MLKVPKSENRLQITALEIASIIRSKRWHGEDGKWSLLEWAGAMAGEAGEAANVAKKIKRVDSGVNNIPSDKRTKDTREELCLKLAKEAADTILYAILVINEAGFDSEEIIREVFNTKSEEYGFPEMV